MKLGIKPHFTIREGDRVYLYRWHLIPRNKYFNIYLHKFVGDDPDRALHDHPWRSWSWLFKGSYQEIKRVAYQNSFTGKTEVVESWQTFGRWSWIRREAEYAHRIVLFKDIITVNDIAADVEVPVKHLQLGAGEDKLFEIPRPAWTIFITGRRVRDWGFWCPQGWRFWKEFVDPKNHGKIGKGCD